MKTKYLCQILGLSLLSLAACDSFLNETPDNRTELDSDNVSKILLSAYPTTYVTLIGEMSSDNTDQFPNRFSELNRLQSDMYKWEASSERNQDSPAALWESCYISIAAANQALNTISKAGNPASLSAARGEALVCRAFNHFLLATTFCKAYTTSASTNLGIPYMKSIETTVNPSYTRNTLEETYRFIAEDLEAGVDLISDEVYKVPKYHFNRAAAAAFAARFYLYYVQPDKSNFDKVIYYANQVLGEGTANSLRDWESLGLLNINDNIQPNAYVSATNSANLLLLCTRSLFPYVTGPYSTGERYNHGPILATETCRSDGPWGTFTSNPETSIYYQYVWSNSTALPTKVMFRKIASYFEYTDPVAQTGYNNMISAVFTTDETLLCRAEAYALKGDYENAVRDLNFWQKAFTRATTPLTIAYINKYYGRLAYYTPTAPTVKKALHPDFSLDLGVQENLIHCILHARRITTLHEGLRWYDVKRYGIEISRRQFNSDGVITVTDNLASNDDRTAIQIPSDVIAAGMQPNPRSK